LSLNPVRHTGAQLPRYSSSSRPVHWPAFVLASTRRAVTADTQGRRGLDDGHVAAFEDTCKPCKWPASRSTVVSARPAPKTRHGLPTCLCAARHANVLAVRAAGSIQGSAAYYRWLRGGPRGAGTAGAGGICQACAPLPWACSAAAASTPACHLTPPAPAPWPLTSWSRPGRHWHNPAAFPHRRGMPPQKAIQGRRPPQQKRWAVRCLHSPGRAAGRREERQRGAGQREITGQLAGHYNHGVSASIACRAAAFPKQPPPAGDNPISSPACIRPWPPTHQTRRCRPRPTGPRRTPPGAQRWHWGCCRSPDALHPRQEGDKCA